MDAEQFSVNVEPHSMKTLKFRTICRFESACVRTVATGRRLMIVLLMLAIGTFTLPAALLDVWRAEDLNLNEGDLVSTWNSASNRMANANVGEAPTLRLNATPAGTRVVRFNGSQRLSAANSPAGGRS